jgi:hypothetical protein
VGTGKAGIQLKVQLDNKAGFCAVNYIFPCNQSLEEQ